MSLASIISNRRVKKGSIVALGISGVLALAAMLAPASGAWYFDTREGHSTVSIASFGLNVEGEHSGAFNFDFNNLSPGFGQAETFSVANTGSLTGYLTMYGDDLQAPGLTNDDMSHLSFYIQGYGYLQPQYGQMATLDLGSLQPDETRTYSLIVSLDDSVGSEWQGATIANTMNISLAQVQ